MSSSKKQPCSLLSCHHVVSKAKGPCGQQTIFHLIILLRNLSVGFQQNCSFHFLTFIVKHWLNADVNISVCITFLQVSQWGQQTSQKMAKGRIIEVVSSALWGRIHMEIRATVSLTTTFYQLHFFFHSDHQGPLTHTFCFYLFKSKCTFL